MIYRYKNGRFAPKPKGTIWTNPAGVYWTPLDGIYKHYQSLSPADKVKHDAAIKAALEKNKDKRAADLEKRLKPFQKIKRKGYY